MRAARSVQRFLEYATPVRHALSTRLPAAAVLAAGLVLGSLAQASEYRLLEIDGLNVKWGAPAMGTAAADVTYGFAMADQSFPDAINCRALAPMAEISPAWDGEPGRLAEIAAGAFAIWSSEANVTFRPAAPGEAPDILIGAEGEPRRVAFANVWHGPGRDGIAALTRATICFNPKVPWSDGVGPAPAGALDFGTVLAHEIGHAIGLDHPGARGALMAFSNQGDIDHLMPGDIAGSAALYGPVQD